MCHERAQLQNECKRGTRHAPYRTQQLSPRVLDCTDHNDRARDCGVGLVVAFKPYPNYVAHGRHFRKRVHGGDGTNSIGQCLGFRVRSSRRLSDRQYARDAACPFPAYAAADAEHRRCAGKVESKPVNTELRFYGNVQVDERRQAYVQTRFAGWIRKVYADATGNFIGKGQTLFTIYSPDLVSTEHEYLLAKKNSESLQQSKVSGVASGASSLFSAAKE